MCTALQGCNQVQCHSSLGVSFETFPVYRLTSSLFMLSVFMQTTAQDYFSVHSCILPNQLVLFSSVFSRCPWFSIHIFNTRFHFLIQYLSGWKKKCFPGGKQASKPWWFSTLLFLGSTSSSAEDLLTCLLFRIVTALRHALGLWLVVQAFLKNLMEVLDNAAQNELFLLVLFELILFSICFPVFII